jgi:hypothetical protein
VITGNLLGGGIDFSQVGTSSFATSIVITGNQLNGGEASVPFYPGLEVSFSYPPTSADGGYIIGPGPYHIFGNWGSKTTNLDIMSVCGHIYSYPMMALQPSMTWVTNATAAVDGGASNGSNDLAGRITLNVTGAGTAAGTQCTLKYAKGYDGRYAPPPKVVLQAENIAAAGVMNQIYCPTSGSSYLQFVIASTAGLPDPGGDHKYIWSYHVLG